MATKKQRIDLKLQGKEEKPVVVNSINYINNISDTGGDVNYIKINEAQTLTNEQKQTFLSNLDSYVQFLGMPFVNIPTNGSTVTLNISPVIPYAGRYLLSFNFVFRVVFRRNRRVRLYTQLQLQSNQFNDTKFIDNFYDYYSYNVNQILSFEKNFTYLLHFTSSDAITISFRNFVASKVLMMALVDGNVAVINY